MSRTTRVNWPIFFVVVGATFLSGTAALIYEVVWSRMLSVVVGNSADAIAIVLASFMLGMALGARFLGGVADKVRFPLRLFAGLEILVAGIAALMPRLLPALNSIEALRGTFEHNPTAAAGRVILVAATIVIPAIAMGATVPIVLRALVRTADELKKRVGVIYGANTLGAAVGASVAGFLCIPSLGLATTSLVGASLSLLAGILMFAVAGLVDCGPITDCQSTTKEEVESGAFLRFTFSPLLVLFVSGFVMMAAELIWSRVLTFIFGHDTYAFAVLLSSVLVGLGIGGILFRSLAERNAHLVTGILVGLNGLVLVGCYWIAASITVKYGRDPFGLGDVSDLAYSLRLEFFREMLFAPLLVLLPAILAGATVPAALASLARRSNITGANVGLGILANGLGSAIGALLAAQGLVSLFGIQGTFFFLGSLLGLASLVVFVLNGDLTPLKKRFYLVFPAVLMLLVIAVMPEGLPKSMLQGAVGKRHQEIQHYEEGRIGTVSVTRNRVNGEKQLFMNSVNEVTTRLVHDQSFKMLGHLGPLLHPEPRTGLMICLGAGMSAGAALVHPLAKLDVVELSDAIFRAAHLWKSENNDVLADPRFHLHFGDGRHFLSQSSERYDVVMVDSTHPKSVDSWILYTKEFYELIRSRLSEGGIAVQWVPLHGLSELEFKIILRTFLGVFPRMTLWSNVGFEVYGQAAYVKLVGMEDELQIDYKELDLRLREPRIARDLKPFGMDDPIEILDGFQASAPAIKLWTEGLPIQTDDRPIVPYITDFSAGRRMEAALLLGIESPIFAHLTGMGDLESSIRQKLSKAVEARGFVLARLLDKAAKAFPGSKKIALFEERVSQGKEYYLSLAKLYSDDGDKLFEIANYLGNVGYPEEAYRLYEQALQLGTYRIRAEINLALVEFDLGKARAAAKRLQRLRVEQPNNALINFNLGVILKEMDRPAEGATYLRQAAERSPELVAAKVALADAERMLGRMDKAEATLRQVISANHWVAEAWDILGLIAGSRRNWDRARKMHIQALKLEPYRASTHYNLGIALQETGRFKDAREAYRTAIQIDAEDPLAQNNLGMVEAGLGNFAEAIDRHQRALDLNPQYAEAAYNKGLAWRALGERWRAMEAFEAALEIDSSLEAAEKQLNEVRPAMASPPDGGPEPQSP